MKLVLLVICTYALSVIKSYGQSSYFAEVNPNHPGALFSQAGIRQTINTQQGSSSSLSTFVKGQIAFNANNAVLAQVPLSYITNTKQCGISDITVKYTFALKRKISPVFAGLFVGLEAILPTGSPQNGLGNGRWVLQPSVTSVFTFGPIVSLATTLSYLHHTTSFEKGTKTFAFNGLAFRPFLSIRLAKPFFLFASGEVIANKFHSSSATNYSTALGAFYVFSNGKYNLKVNWNTGLSDNNNVWGVALLRYL